MRPPPRGAAASALAALLLSACAAVTLQGSSMLPTLHDGERVTYERYEGRAPQRGDIVVFRKGDGLRLSRVVGLPGEAVRIANGRVLVGGTLLNEPYLASGTRTDGSGAWAVPAESYFVLGDNRGAAQDSRDREFGFVARDDVLGRVVR